MRAVRAAVWAVGRAAVWPVGRAVGLAVRPAAGSAAVLSLLAGGLAGLAAALGAGGRRGVVRVLAVSGPRAGSTQHRPGPRATAGPHGPGDGWPGTTAARRRLGRARIACAVAGSGLVALFGPVPGGVLAAGVIAFLPARLAALEPVALRRERERIRRDAPVAADLLAAALEAGAPLVEGLLAVSDALGGPVGGRLAVVAGLLAYGELPATAWSVATAGAGAGLGPIGQVAVTADSAGAALTGQFRSAAAEGRAAHRAEVLESARKVGVRAVAPLGLCFLPAFVLLGVVPVVAASLGHLVG